jgi:small subunit ribosomal protein S5
MPRIDPNLLDLEEQVIRTNKVQKTHKGGRTMSWSVLVAVGDRNGHVGIGLGKASAIPDAIRKSIEDAKKNLISVPLVGSTLPHEVSLSFGAARVVIRPASSGTGVVAGGAVRPILELAGVRDVLAKSLGSRNAINSAKATIACLKAMRVAERISESRGVAMEEMVPWLVRKRKLEEPEVASTETEQAAEGVETEVEETQSEPAE